MLGQIRIDLPRVGVLVTRATATFEAVFLLIRAPYYFHANFIVKVWRLAIFAKETQTIRCVGFAVDAINCATIWFGAIVPILDRVASVVQCFKIHGGSSFVCVFG